MSVSPLKPTDREELIHFNSPEDIKREWFSTEVIREEGRTLHFKLTELGVAEIANKGYGVLHLEY